MDRLFDHRPLRLFLWLVAAFYAYGAAVHVMNMASLTGFDWGRAPRLWQVLDLAYLALDAAVVIGIVLRRAFGVVAFLAAAVSQIVLYTAFRDAVAMAGTPHALGPDQLAYLSLLVAFHAATLAVFAVLAWRAGSRARLIA